MNGERDLIKKNNVRNFIDLLSVCMGKAQANQLNLLDILGEHKRWNVDVTRGKLTIDDKDFDIEFIGTESATNNTWLWADANNGIPEEAKTIVKQIYSIGKAYGIPEFLEDNLPIEGLINGHNLSSIACILLSDKLCYYRGKSDESAPAVFMFVKSADAKIFEPVDTNRFNRIVMECISAYELNHWLFIKSFMELNNCSIDVTEQSIIGIWPNGNKFIAKFDESNRYINAEITMSGN